MRDAQVAELAGRQHNRISRSQLLRLGLSDHAIAHRVAAGRLVILEQGVFAVAPVDPDDDMGLWMGATLTAPGTALCRRSAAAAWGCWNRRRPLETVIRPGNGGPRRHGGLLVYRSPTLAGEITEHEGIRLTTMPRTLLDVAPTTDPRTFAWMVREAVRLGRTTVPALGDALGRYRGRRGTRKLGVTIARYTGLPLERARSGAEVRAMELLRDGGRPMPRLNAKVAGEEADLSWPTLRLIVEIDGAPFHLDVGEDARKQAAWERAGWAVRRLPSDDVYERPDRLLALAPDRPS